MTCIVAISNGSTVLMAGDSAVDFGDMRLVCADPKVWKTDTGVVIGFAGAAAVQDRVEATANNLPRLATRQNIIDWVPALRKSWDDESELLIGAGARIFLVGNDLSVCTLTDYAAIGTGERYALGSLASTPTHVDPRRRARKALAVATMFCGNVMPPYIFEDTCVT